MSIVSADSSHRFGPDDVEFAEEFGRRAGMALDNARLMTATEAAYRAAERNSARLGVLTAVVGELSGATDITAVAAAAVDGGAAALGATRGVVVLRRSEEPHVVASIGYDQETLANYTTIVDEPGPLRESMETGRPVYCDSLLELKERYPNLAGLSIARDSSYAAIPLAPFGEVRGVMGLVFEPRPSFDDDDRKLLSALGLHIGVAIERSRLYDESRTVATELQRALAPPPVEDLAGLEAAARYEPADGRYIGGDWYDIVRTPRGTLCFIVGDVVGRGLDAVAAMAQLRHSSRLMLLEGRTPGRAMHALDVLARTEPKMLGSTVLCVDLEPESRCATVVSLGHLPPFLVNEGSAHLLELPVNPPLGIGNLLVSEFSLTLGQGDVIVLLTDGVIERRDRAIDASLEAARSMLEGLAPDPHVIADALIDWGQDASDDRTVLVVRPRSD
jgi:GAF domain-containing protein